MSLLVTFSRMKWTLTSICFVRACDTGFDARARALELSHQMIGGEGK
jgi:hypothetical protein